MDPEYLRIRNLVENDPHMIASCYKTNNNFAYKYDKGESYWSEMKTENYVPSYDHWCLACPSRAARQRCSKCKSVYFCDEKCQRAAWKIHKKHCGRNLFQICIVCGKDGVMKCENCPVKFCSEVCKKRIYKLHREIDCDNLKRIYGK